MLASNLNGIAASVRCVSSIKIVLNAKLTRLIAAQENKKDSEKRKNPKEAAVAFAAFTNDGAELKLLGKVDTFRYKL